jgi:hypothetical protein
MVKNLLTGLWLPIQNCTQEPTRKNSPGVDHAQGTGTDPLESNPIGIKSYPALALLSPGSGNVDRLTEFSQFKAQSQKIPSTTVTLEKSNYRRIQNDVNEKINVNLKIISLKLKYTKL